MKDLPMRLSKQRLLFAVGTVILPTAIVMFLFDWFCNQLLAPHPAKKLLALVPTDLLMPPVRGVSCLRLGWKNQLYRQQCFSLVSLRCHSWIL
jgi:hypothetical protein